jgi:branched-chain amino acid transport system ATP-binding protein
MHALLSLKHVSKDFGGLRAVDDVSLDIHPGQIIGLIGPNGSGKSTLLSLIDGTQRPMSGQIVFDGQDIAHLPADAIFRLGLGRGFQDPSLFFQMSVLDNTLLPVKQQKGEKPWYAPFRGLWLYEEQVHGLNAASVLRRIQIAHQHDRAAADLSGGQMKLLEIGRSMMGQPRMLLLDEPTAGVAPGLAYSIFEEIEAMRAELGLTFLIIEHRLEILFDFADFIYVMHLGRLLAQGSPDEIAASEMVREVYFGS